MVLGQQGNKKIILVEGPQGVGKSFLINYLLKDISIVHFKFEFSKWINLLNKQNDLSFKDGLSLGKDLAVMKLLNSIELPYIIIERSFLSHFVWGDLEKRISSDYLKTLINLINDLITSKNLNIYLVLITGQNQKFFRKRGDGYDSIANYSEQLILYRKYIIKFLFKNIITFTNYFDKRTIEDFKLTIKGIISEH
jgi:hypothetical protein